MAYPKFEIGEVVVLQSQQFPQFNGDKTVFKIVKGRTPHKCRLVEGALVTYFNEDDGYGYLFEEPIPAPDDGVEMSFHERALRKKHQPGEMGFQDLMASLVSPKLLTHQPGGVVAVPPQ